MCLVRFIDLKALHHNQDTPGNLAGDGMQLGATLVIDQTGNVIYEFRQKYVERVNVCWINIMCA